MSLLNSLINRPCKIVRRSPSGEIDEYGDEEPTEAIVDTVCEIQQRARDEDELAGELSDTLWTVFFLPGEQVGTGDQLIVDGQVYEFVGEPWDARNPRLQAASHIEATVRRTGPEVGS